MKKMKILAYLCIYLLLVTGCMNSEKNKKDYLNESGNTIQERILSLRGFKRVKYPKNSYQEYVRNLKVKKAGSKIYLYNGKEKIIQNNHVAVVDLDVGKQDLQQCADAIMRIRAEYLYSTKQYNKIQFHLSNGFLLKYLDYQNGFRLFVDGDNTKIYKKSSYSNSYKTFRLYLDDVFNYASTISLIAESKKQNLNDIKPGDFWVDNEHAVIVVDVIENIKTNQKAFLVAQSYMPAQSIHILDNKNSDSPWYLISQDMFPLKTPEWTFKKNDLMKH